jgi:hypothetical protein
MRSSPKEIPSGNGGNASSLFANLGDTIRQFLEHGNGARKIPDGARKLSTPLTALALRSGEAKRRAYENHIAGSPDPES